MLGRASPLKENIFYRSKIWAITITRIGKENNAKEKMGNHHDVGQGIATWRKELIALKKSTRFAKEKYKGKKWCGAGHPCLKKKIETVTIKWVCKEKYAKENMGNHHDIGPWCWAGHCHLKKRINNYKKSTGFVKKEYKGKNCAPTVMLGRATTVILGRASPLKEKNLNYNNQMDLQREICKRKNGQTPWCWANIATARKESILKEKD